MSELSAEEKRKLLRERRQAKMAQGKATDRLNNILSQGSSVKSSNVTSVLDKPEKATTTVMDLPSRETQSPTPLHDDPEVPDITSLLKEKENEAPDMEAMLQQILGGSGAHTGPGNDGGANFLQEMMKAMAEDPSGGSTAEESSYQSQLSQYHAYEQKQWKARFLVVRWIIHTLNFVYHYIASGYKLLASPYAFVRAQAVDSHVRTFFTAFLTVEVAVISAYFLVMSQPKFKDFSRENLVSRILSMASAVVPAVGRYQPLVTRALVYWNGASIFVGDLMLMVFYFGITSVLGN